MEAQKIEREKETAKRQIELASKVGLLVKGGA